MKLILQRKQGGEWKEVTGGADMQALDLLTTVTSFLTSEAVRHAVSSYPDLTGNAFLCVAYNTRPPKELWLLDPTKVEVVKEDVIPFQEYDPISRPSAPECI